MKTCTKTLFVVLAVLIMTGPAVSQNFMRLDASFYSQALGEVRMIDVYLPPDYYVNPDQHYAVIYYLHGGGGNQNSSSTYAMWYYNLYQQDTTKTAPAAIFVSPDGSSPPFLGSAYLNSSLYGNYEDYIIEDVIGFIEENFRAYPHKNFRLITGTSMGGFGSAWLAANHPDKFRASFPYVGFPAMPDTLLETWKNLVFNDNGSFNPTYGAGTNTDLFFTMVGGLSPNPDNPPYFVDMPFDTLGNWVDTVLQRWYTYDVSRKVKDLPGEHELAWFLGCGTTDYMCTYPAYLQFADSLSHYGIAYDYRWFDGGHVLNIPTWHAGVYWMDSIINISFQSVGIHRPDLPNPQMGIYPNPVSDMLNISFHIAVPNQVNISLYDQHGRQLAIISEAYRERGTYRMTYPMTSLQAGVYYIRMKTAGHINTYKVLKF
jgi:enterochelin esterase-like enzyme